MILPRWLGIGVMKAGTSTVHNLLAQHPQIALPSHRKEVMYFDKHHDRPLAWYAGHFAHAADRVPGEITPGYLFDPQAIARLTHALPDVRVWCMLRDPVQRAWSQYKFYVKEHGHDGTFADFLVQHPNAIDRGRYLGQLQHLYAHIPADRVLVLLFEDFVSQPDAVMAQLCAHLGVDPHFPFNHTLVQQNTSAKPRFARLYAAGRRAIGWMYDHNLDWVVHTAKRSGVRRLFLADRPGRAARDFGSPDPASLQMLQTVYAAERDALAALLGRDLDAVWPRSPHT